MVQTKKELKTAASKSKKTEGESMSELEKKIKQNEVLGKELVKDIKSLKKMQHDHGNELVGLDISEQYPEKIKQLMEEIRWASDRQKELEDKIE
ncbi:MAG: hypothetical protein ACMG6E_04470 [Candidatus Roizmanbacteria bacterium]